MVFATEWRPIPDIQTVFAESRKLPDRFATGLRPQRVPASGETRQEADIKAT
jgi:hypothetical protein